MPAEGHYQLLWGDTSKLSSGEMMAVCGAQRCHRLSGLGVRMVNQAAFLTLRQILRLLLLGLDPQTDEPLALESTASSPEVREALALGIEGLETSEWVRRLQGVRRSESILSWQSRRTSGVGCGDSLSKRSAERSGVGWSVQEDRQIAQEFAEGQKLTMMATNHQRSRGSVLARMAHLGLGAGKG